MTGWRAIGLLEGIRRWAHYRHGAKTIARVALGTVRGGCGELNVALRNLPRVFWLTLALPRSDTRAAITKVVNLVVERAAVGVAGLTIVRHDQVFTPAG